MDRHDLYELCVQSARHAVEMLRAIHGGDPRVLGEDFCGTAGVSREWSRRAGCTAVATDIDGAVMERGAGFGVPGVRFVKGDVLHTLHEPCSVDAVFVGNFSIGEIGDRCELVRYFERSKERLRTGGVFVCDTYGGESAYRLGAVRRTHVAPDGSIVEYTWEQRRADAATGRVENALHFRVRRGDEVVLELPDAFVYRWRLWSVPELRDAMTEAGFAATSVHQALDAEDAGALPASFIVCVAGRVNG